MRENNHEYKKKTDTNVLIIGGAVIIVAGVGAYYIYSQNKLLNELKYWVQDYQEEYEEFMEDGVIDEYEREQLEIKRLYIATLIHEIEEKGLLDKAIDMLWSIGIAVPVLLASAIIYKIMDRYFKRHPPRPGQSEQYQDPWDYTWHVDSDELADHIEDAHPVQNVPEPLYDVWTEIQLLPAWIITWLADSVTNFSETWNRGWENTPEWIHFVLISAIAVAIALLLIISLGSLAPTLGPTIQALAAAMMI